MGHEPEHLSARSRSLLTLCSLAFACVTGEFLVRSLYPSISPLRDIVMKVADERGYVLRPNTRREFAGALSRFAHPIVWEINAQGMRDDRPVAPAPPSGRIRIATYGDSETFGWSVSLADTFQKQLEAKNALSVLNFGVPGYNVTNVAKHIEATALFYQPDELIYIIHPNDFEAPVQFIDLPFNSELIMRLAALYHVKIWKKEQLRRRRGPEAARNFIAQLRRIERFCARNRIALAIAFLDRNDRFVLQMDRELRGYFLELGCQDQRVFDFSPVMRRFPKVDNHLSKQGHAELARLLSQRLRQGGKTGCELRRDRASTLRDPLYVGR